MNESNRFRGTPAEILMELLCPTFCEGGERKCLFILFGENYIYTRGHPKMTSRNYLFLNTPCQPAMYQFFCFKILACASFS